MSKAFDIIGDKQIEAQLKNLGRNAERRIMRPAVSKALTPVNRQAKANARAQLSSSTISRMIGKRVWSNRNRRVVGKVYVRPDKTGRTIILEGRVVPFEVVANILEFGRKDGSMPPRPMVRVALEQQRGAVRRILATEIPINQAKEVAKQRAKGLLK